MGYLSAWRYLIRIVSMKYLVVVHDLVLYLYVLVAFVSFLFAYHSA